LMLPLVSRGETIGLMEFADVTDRSWDPEMEFFGALTDVVAAAAHNAVLHDEFREAQERYRVLVENLPAITYVDLAGSGDPLYVSPQIDELMGIPAAEWLDGVNGWGRRGCPPTPATQSPTTGTRSRPASPTPRPTGCRDWTAACAGSATTRPPY